MNKIFIILSLVFLSGCVTPKLEEAPKELKIVEPVVEIVKPKVVIKVDTTPKWYKNKELQVEPSDEVIAYAKANTLAKAQDKAIENIVVTMFNKAHKSSVGQLDMANLNTLRQEQKKGKFFVALSYKNDNLVYKVKSMISAIECDDESINSYIKQTPIFDSFNCNLDIKLERKNKEWYLKYKENLFELKDEEFKEFFTSIKNSNFDFTISKENLVEEDKFHFSFKTKDSGYITLLDIYKNGIVTMLDTSIEVKRDLTIPSQEEGYSYEATTLNSNEDTHNLYVAIFTREPIELAMFEYENQDMTSNELAYKLGELIDMLDGYEYSTILVETKAR